MLLELGPSTVGPFDVMSPAEGQTSDMRLRVQRLTSNLFILFKSRVETSLVLLCCIFLVKII
jgi:hypothetical protein